MRHRELTHGELASQLREAGRHYDAALAAVLRAVATTSESSIASACLALGERHALVRTYRAASATHVLLVAEARRRLGAGLSIPRMIHMLERMARC